MSTPSLDDVRKQALRLAAKIGAPLSALPTFGHTQDNARPHVEVDPLLAYVIVERGRELSRESFARSDALMERIFVDVTFEMASSFELEHRRPSEDFRRQLFNKQLSYLTVLDSSWAEHQRRALNEVLAANPFTDGLQPTQL